MQTIQTNEIKLSPLLRKALGQGETLLVSDDEGPIALLIGMESPPTPRPFGLCKGEFEVPDDFDDLLPEFEAMFTEK